MIHSAYKKLIFLIIPKTGKKTPGARVAGEETGSNVRLNYQTDLSVKWAANGERSCEREALKVASWLGWLQANCAWVSGWIRAIISLKLINKVNSPRH